MNVDLLAISSELGYIEDGVYTADQNCKENLDSIYEMVQKDDEAGSYRQQVGSTGIFSSDLIPLLGQKIDDDEIFDSLIRLLTSMTDPVRLSSTADRSKVDMYNQKVIEGFLLEYKKSFHNALLWVKLREKIVRFLRKECPKNSPDLTGLTLNFVRNLITIDDVDESQVLIICYADSGMARLIQYIASAADLDEWHLHATEIFSGLLKDISPIAISSVDPQKDALKHESFGRPCVVMDECSVEYTPSMEDRMQSAKSHRHYENIFLHYYFSSISKYCAEPMAKSLLAKADSIDSKYKIAVAQMCVWLINFVSVFDSNILDLGAPKNERARDKVSNLFAMGIQLSANFIDNSSTGLMQSFVRRSTDLLSILKQFSSSYGLQSKSGELPAIAKKFLTGKVRQLLSFDNGQLGGFVFEFVDALLSFLPATECELLINSLQESDMLQSISQYLSKMDFDQLTPVRCETMLNVISKSTKSINELCTKGVLRLIFASTTKICSTELNDFQIRIFQHIKSMASTEQELIQVCTRVVDDDPKLLAELALLFQFESPRPSNNDMETSKATQEKVRDWEAEAQRIKPLLLSGESRICKLADRIHRSLQKGTLTEVIDVPDEDVGDIVEALQYFGFNLDNKVWLLQPGHTLHPTQLKAVDWARPLASDAVSLVTSRSIGFDGGLKKKKKRGIGKNKKLGGVNAAPAATDAAQQRQMEIF